MFTKRPRTRRSFRPAVCSSRRRFPLPAELILQITSHLDDDFRYHDKPYCQDAFPFDYYFQRQAALRALSQTSRLLRSVCLPILWEYLDVYCYPRFAGFPSLDAEFRRHKLARMTSGLIGNPTLAALVRCVVSSTIFFVWFCNHKHVAVL
jgi:hypothetical protein